MLNPSFHEGHHDEPVKLQGLLVCDASCSWTGPGQQFAVAPQLLAHKVSGIPCLC